MTDLGHLGIPENNPPNTGALAMSDRDQVVGGSNTANGQTHAFFWESGIMTDLGTFNGQDFSLAHAVNDKGTMVVGIGSGNNRALVWTR